MSISSPHHWGSHSDTTYLWWLLYHNLFLIPGWFGPVLFLTRGQYRVDNDTQKVHSRRYEKHLLPLTGARLKYDYIIRYGWISANVIAMANVTPQSLLRQLSWPCCQVSAAQPLIYGLLNICIYLDVENWTSSLSYHVYVSLIYFILI